MSQTGLCQVCEAAPGRFTCDACGAYVCTDHFDVESGRCTACADRLRGGRSP